VKSYTACLLFSAAWISNKPLDGEFIRLFNEANAFGVNNIPEVISSLNFNNSVDPGRIFQELYQL
jgi:hypothetical protein